MNSSGTNVVLARFPSSGTLSAFGLTPGNITHLALPNDLQAWPTTALDGCGSLETIAVYGPENDDKGTITITAGHHLQLLTRLWKLQLPSTVTGTEDCPTSISCFPTSLRSVSLSKNTTQIGSEAFLHAQISHINLSKCKKLREVRRSAFNATPLTSLDLSGCISLVSFVGGVFYNCTQLKTVIWRNKLRVTFYPVGDSTAFSATSVLFEIDLELID